ncbi:peptide-methionine (S)-S-oxide reductase MsrA [Granulicella sp. 5B5]|uniref:peptide-methionine (S)-S-oxide reductase MsrA n=1 Tax=Granulicella sp. 5B5 TaxID=1617967 RepID=UPI0031FC3FE6
MGVNLSSPLTIAMQMLEFGAVLVIAIVLWRSFTQRRNSMAVATRREPIPAPIEDINMPESGWETGELDTAVFAGGCFWGVQSVFQRVKGVVQTTVGYSGGSEETANYRAVCGEDTGHAEAIEVLFDPSKVSYGTLLRIFFSVVHDPTQLNRQGADVGTSYRSAIFFTDDQQRKVAEAYVKQLDAAQVFHAPIVTQIVPLERFYKGEDYHQDYAMKNPHNPYIQVCDVPKIAALGQQFPDLFQEYGR